MPRMTLASTLLLTSLPLLVHLYAKRYREEDKAKAFPDNPSDFSLPVAQTYDFIIGRKESMQSLNTFLPCYANTFTYIFQFRSGWWNRRLCRGSSSGRSKLLCATVGSGRRSHPNRKCTHHFNVPKVPSRYQLPLSVHAREECSTEKRWCKRNPFILNSTDSFCNSLLIDLYLGSQNTRWEDAWR